MCPGNRIIFTCQESGPSTVWSINLQPRLDHFARSTQVGSVIPFGDHFGFNFELHVVSFNSSIDILTTELQVTAVRELNGIIVECAGASITIQVASVGELMKF